MIDRVQAVLNLSGAVLVPVGMWVQFGFGAFLITVGVLCFVAAREAKG